MEKQRSPEWFAQRVGRVTGSNVGAILGLDPYRSRNDVLRAMVRAHHGVETEFLGNPATEWGVLNESNATFDLELDMGFKVEETGFHAYEHWLGASPDGKVEDDAVAEIKCPYSMRNSDKQFKTIEEQRHYYAQVQIEMLCTGTSKCYFYQWAPDVSHLQVINLDQPWLDENLLILKAFHEEFLTEINNPEHLLDLRPVIRNKKVADNYLEAKLGMDNAKDDLDAAKEALIQVAAGRNCEISGLKLTLVNKKGSVSYSKMVTKLLPNEDLEPYRGKESEYWKIS